MTHGSREAVVAEQRKHRRLGLSLPAEIMIKNNGKRLSLGEATTRDISTGGAYLRTDLAHRFEVGSRVSIQFRLPTDVCQSMVLRNMSAQATVIRVEAPRAERSSPSDSGCGIAVQFTRRPVFSSIFD